MKKWYRSKTIWVAGASLVAAILTALLADPAIVDWLNLYAKWALPVLMGLLRVVTSAGVK